MHVKVRSLNDFNSYILFSVKFIHISVKFKGSLDARMTHRSDYNYKIPLASLTDLALTQNLTQIVTFNTWSRTIKGIKKESLLDHVYVNNFASVNN